MPELKQRVQPTSGGNTREKRDDGLAAKRPDVDTEAIMAEIDDLLDEIDSVLDQNFDLAKNFVQVGGE